jgi:RNA polymerase sigma-70 factor (ECF subfamily)
MGSQPFAFGLTPGTMIATPRVSADRMDYEQLYRDHRPQILRICRLLLADPDEAEDVAQEVLLKLLNEHRTNGNIAWRPWLNRVTVNACRDRRRSGWWKWWRSQPHELEESEFAHRDPTPEQQALGEETRRAIWEAFRRLPARQREVFALRYLEGCSTEETAETLGLSTGSVKTHLFRAVHQMRASLRGAS